MRQGKISITWEQNGRVYEIYVIMNSIWGSNDTLPFTLNIMYYKIIVAPYMLWLHQVDISFGGEVGISYVVTFGWFGAPTPLKYLNPLQCFENRLVINFLVLAQCLWFYS